MQRLGVWFRNYNVTTSLSSIWVLSSTGMAWELAPGFTFLSIIKPLAWGAMSRHVKNYKQLNQFPFSFFPCLFFLPRLPLKTTSREVSWSLFYEGTSLGQVHCLYFCTKEIAASTRYLRQFICPINTGIVSATQSWCQQQYNIFFYCGGGLYLWIHP